MLKSGRKCDMPQEVDASSVQEWTFGLKPRRTKGSTTAATSSAKPRATVPSKEGSTVNCELNCPVWPKPYAKDLLEAGPEILLTTSAATEIEFSSAFGN